MHTRPRLGLRPRAAEIAGNPWVRFLAARLLSVILILGALGLSSFMMVRLIPGDAAELTAGPDATPEGIELIRRELGLDKALDQQVIAYGRKLLVGDLGVSFATKRPVRAVIEQRAGSSFQLASLSLALVLLVSIPVGMLAAAFTREGRHKRAEIAFTSTTSVVGALPEYLMATFLAFIFAVWLRLLPVGGDLGWQSLILPVLSIGLRPVAVLARVVRVETLNVLATDYIRTARSKRLPWRLIYLRHVLPNVIVAALTIGGLLFASIIGGAVIVENVFARPGLGSALVMAVLSRDYPLIQGIILVLGATVVLTNTLVDVALAVVDPRSMARQG